MATKKSKAKKTTTKKTASKGRPRSSVATHERGVDDAKDGKDKAAGKAKTFMDETRDDDRADAITKGIAGAVSVAQTGVKELRTTLDLITQTSEPKDVHYLLEFARRVAGQVCLALQEEITKAKKLTKEAKLPW